MLIAGWWQSTLPYGTGGGEGWVEGNEKVSGVNMSKRYFVWPEIYMHCRRLEIVRS